MDEVLQSKRRAAIENYISAYNGFDVRAMLKDFDPAVVFKNVSGGEVTLETRGIEQLAKQAEAAKDLFTTREQKIVSMKFEADRVEVEIDYTGVLAVDLPNGLNAGDSLKMKGRSIFTFVDEKIVGLEDIG